MKKFCAILLTLVIAVGCNHRGLKPPTQISVVSEEQLDYWDQIAQEAAHKYSLIDGNRHRFFAYLYQAQHLFYQMSEGRGDLGPVSLHVIQLFMPQFSMQYKADPSESEWTSAVMQKINARFEKEKMHAKELHFFPESWSGKEPYFGIYAPSMEPWFVKSAYEFRAPPPPYPENTPFWQNQLTQVRKAMQNLTAEQTKVILYWDREADWKYIAAEFMRDNKLPLSDQMELRALLACCLEDTFITLWDSKYTYLVRRPYQLDPKLKIVVPDPNHPTYPCAHCGLSAAAVTILGRYFPDKRDRLEQMLQEASLSRIQAGLHFPIDVIAAITLGRSVGNASLERFNSL